MDFGISPHNAEKIRGQVFEAGNEIHFHRPDSHVVSTISTFYDVSRTMYPPASYGRLFLDLYLPETVGRVIYLDVDILVLADLGRLWDMPFEGAAFLAVPDPLAQAELDAHRGGARMQHSHVVRSILPLVGDPAQVRDFRYFQTGVLVFNLARYREGGQRRYVECVRQNPDLKFPDQDAINLEFINEIKVLDPRWNMVNTVYGLIDENRLSLSAQEAQELVERPFIVHFTSRPKPWELNCVHPWRDAWFDYIDSSPYHGWRPNRINRLPAQARKVMRRVRKSKAYEALGLGI